MELFRDLEEVQFFEYGRSPAKAANSSRTPFATLNDVIESRDDPVPNATPKNDVLTWSTPQSKEITPSRKKPSRTSYAESPIPTREPIPYESQQVDEEDNLPEFSPQERNALIQAYLGNSILTNEFFETLRTRCGVEPSFGLKNIAESHDAGKTVKFLDICREITQLLDNRTFPKITQTKSCGDKLK